MKETHEKTQNFKNVVIIKKCHCCGQINEGHREVERCLKCHKSFLPTNYFGKVHAKTSESYKQLFSASYELHEEDLVKGICVLW